ncbi:uncharacterized protein LY79DRAFT_546723 [Colletotrichum navitas]|uniref:Uncharacterized protein n=1 Tax=Colletotrichum navitas TaxID=681940 RepID=A0AAD8V8K8_9PEZI|nr:uncharacterized protein LY79DRAFT_546723 [Colletotrichum navitas]KAK1595550.1 hypothetical protein LY79DRAFT_546723 [Colletotrichum navitas]
MAGGPGRRRYPYSPAVLSPFIVGWPSLTLAAITDPPRHLFLTMVHRARPLGPVHRRVRCRRSKRIERGVIGRARRVMRGTVP